jgi:xanthine dehydrogenase accessory factor
MLAAIDEIISALDSGIPAVASPCIRKAFSCFDPEALADDPDVGPADLDRIIEGLSAADLPTFQRARKAVLAHEQAWLGFKIVTDPAVVCDSTDTDVAGFSGEGQGSADALSGVFFATEDKQIVFAREYSPRDRKQMLDITRGPHMHNNQYAGVAWVSQGLEPTGRVIMFGAGDVSVALESIAQMLGFETAVIDYDPNYLNETRFPRSERLLIDDFTKLGDASCTLAGDLNVSSEDYLCVLTRGHMHDPEAIAWAVGTEAGYVGMMGNPMKNERVFELAAAQGIDPRLFEAERLHAPIGLRLGGKTPAEIALQTAIQIIDIRQKRPGRG